VTARESDRFPAKDGLTAQFWYPQVMRRPRCRLILSLTGAALLTLPLHSQRVEISEVQASPSAQPQQNGPAPVTPPQAPLPTQVEESPALTVVLDPAHGGADFGARGPTGLTESDSVLDFARAARIALEAQRLRVLLTREGNQDPSFDNRSAMINGLKNAIFISLHVSSSGPAGTARTYYYVFPPNGSPAADRSSGAPTPTQTAPVAQASVTQTTPPTGLIPWDDAQRSSVDSSRQLAFLVQTVLVQRFKGSPDAPIAAPVRQLRTIAAPAIAIELSSIDVTDAKRLDQMAQPLAEAIGRAASEFHPLRATAADASGMASSGGH
jgi:N-acetylmuramoyl-L-alanine amidase